MTSDKLTKEHISIWGVPGHTTIHMRIEMQTVPWKSKKAEYAKTGINNSGEGAELLYSHTFPWFGPRYAPIRKYISQRKITGGTVVAKRKQLIPCFPLSYNKYMSCIFFLITQLCNMYYKEWSIPMCKHATGRAYTHYEKSLIKLFNDLKCR